MTVIERTLARYPHPVLVRMVYRPDAPVPADLSGPEEVFAAALAGAMPEPPPAELLCEAEVPAGGFVPRTHSRLYLQAVQALEARGLQVDGERVVYRPAPSGAVRWEVGRIASEHVRLEEPRL